eukprot:Clim_evm20s242 gene=Clim_evmTU20s242
MAAASSGPEDVLGADSYAQTRLRNLRDWALRTTPTIDQGINARLYAKTAGTTLDNGSEELNKSRGEGQMLRDAYVHIMRALELSVQRLPTHPKYKEQTTVEQRNELKRKCKKAFEELETIKTLLLDHFREEHAQALERQRQLMEAAMLAPEPGDSDDEELEDVEGEYVYDEDDDLVDYDDGEGRAEKEFQDLSRQSYGTEENPPAYTSHAGQTIEDLNQSSSEDEGPLYGDAAADLYTATHSKRGKTAVPDRSSKPKIPGMASGTVPPPVLRQSKPMSTSSSLDYNGGSYPSVDRHSKPTILGPAMPDRNSKPTHLAGAATAPIVNRDLKHGKKAKDAKKRNERRRKERKDSGATAPVPLGKRTVEIPQDLMDRFLTIASTNTARNVETMGILLGKVRKTKLVCKILAIPKQTGTSDSVETEREEDVLEYQLKHDLITMGWIHTHPTQTCFMSSVDLHTHCSYQLMLPEAVAIVVAPRYGDKGSFSLTQPYGLQYIAKCTGTGFHPHPENPPLYEQSPLVRFKSSETTVVDFR